MSKKSAGKKILLFILIVILVLVLAVGGLFAFSAIDRKKPIDLLPHDYSVYVHTDSAWKALEPLLDLKAVDMYLSSPELAELRGIFMQLRASEWRNNKILAYLASKTIDFGLYEDAEGEMTFLACVDLKALSAVSRLAPFYINTFSPEIENLSFEDGIFVYETDDSYYYIKPYKNLVLATNDWELLDESLAGDFEEYSKQDLQLINKKSEEPVKIIVNAQKLLISAQNGEETNGLIPELLKVIPENSLSSISFRVTDNDIKLNAHIPFAIPEENSANIPLATVLGKRSTTPAILSRFRENVQYYTILNAGTLEQLKNSFMPLFINNADFLWTKYNGLSKAYLNITLDDLLFSWSGTEVAIFGIENKNDPVFAIQIKDEKQRQKVFEKFLSSVLVKDNSSLILDGIRLPRIELPGFLQELLRLFDITLPKPYYLIQDGYIYFTESPENLCEIYKAQNKIGKISADENWNVISKDLTSDSTVSLYYNLERSIPFFLKSKANLARVLSLYAIGRTDVCITDSEVVVQLSAISKESEKTDRIAGFPLERKGKVDGELTIESADVKAKTNALYWIEDKHTLVSMEIPSTAINEYDISDTAYLCPCQNADPKSEKTVWCVTEHGAVYLMNRKFETAEGFPLLLGDNVTVRPVTVEGGLYIVTETGRLIFADLNGALREITLEVSGAIKSTPSVYECKQGRILGLYDKSFMGKVIILQDWDGGKTFTFEVPGISYGSPAFVRSKEETLPTVGFITQNGIMHLWELSKPADGEAEDENLLELEGRYKTNVVSNGKYFYALSTQGVLTRITDGKMLLEVQLPDVTCNEAFVTVGGTNIYICPDGNVIYGFDEFLELIYSFPVTGWGRPVFADVDGDKHAECFTLSVDNKLYATSLK